MKIETSALGLVKYLITQLIICTKSPNLASASIDCILALYASVGP